MKCMTYMGNSRQFSKTTGDRKVFYELEIYLCDFMNKIFGRG